MTIKFKASDAYASILTQVPDDIRDDSTLSRVETGGYWYRIRLCNIATLKVWDDDLEITLHLDDEYGETKERHYKLNINGKVFVPSDWMWRTIRKEMARRKARREQRDERRKARDEKRKEMSNALKRTLLKLPPRYHSVDVENPRASMSIFYGTPIKVGVHLEWRGGFEYTITEVKLNLPDLDTISELVKAHSILDTTD